MSRPSDLCPSLLQLYSVQSNGSVPSGRFVLRASIASAGVWATIDRIFCATLEKGEFITVRAFTRREFVSAVSLGVGAICLTGYSQASKRSRAMQVIWGTASTDPGIVRSTVTFKGGKRQCAGTACLPTRSRSLSNSARHSCELARRAICWRDSCHACASGVRRPRGGPIPLLSRTSHPDVDRLQAILATQGTFFERYTYDSEHGFFAYDRDGIFDSTAATLAWQRTVAFLRKHLGRTSPGRQLAPAASANIHERGPIEAVGDHFMFHTQHRTFRMRRREGVAQIKYRLLRGCADACASTHNPCAALPDASSPGIPAR